MAGTGAQSTKETKELCEEAHEAGATYALVLTPSTWFAAMNKENIIRFFTEVSASHALLTCLSGFDRRVLFRLLGCRRVLNTNANLQFPNSHRRHRPRFDNHLDSRVSPQHSRHQIVLRFSSQNPSPLYDIQSNVFRSLCRTGGRTFAWTYDG
jgi:hypothetical protein